MTMQEALEELEAMHRQIIHGPTIFRDIADVIRKQEEVRIAALRAIGTWLNDQHREDLDNDDESLLCHRILATREPDGVHKGPILNIAKS